MAILLLASLAIMLHFSKKAMKEEALNEAAQTLEATVQHIDNILLSVEQAAGNTYFGLVPHFDEPDLINMYCRKLVESNPYIVGCAIAYREGYFKDCDLFMAYYHRTTIASVSQIVKEEGFDNSPYIEQEWFVKPMATGRPLWLRVTPSESPLPELQKDGSGNSEPLITFCLPIVGNEGRPFAIIGVDVSVNRLSQIILTARPSPNSYCTMLDDDGSFIIHPDSAKLNHQTVFTQLLNDADPSVKVAAQAMVSGETGYKPFRMKGKDYYVFYKPFNRTAVPGRYMENLGWSAGIIYPEDDIFGDYEDLSNLVLAIAIIGLLLLFLLCRTIIHRQLKPLLMLTKSAQRIAKGHYDEPITDSRQEDEIGRLQQNFRHMQQSLAAQVAELEGLTATLKEHGKSLEATLKQTQKADRMKTAFLHNMTNQMIAPSDAIVNAVDALSEGSVAEGVQPVAGDSQSVAGDLQSVAGDLQSPTQQVDIIQKNGKAIAELLDHLIRLSDEDMRKEADYE